MPLIRDVRRTQRAPGGRLSGWRGYSNRAGRTLTVQWCFSDLPGQTKETDGKRKRARENGTYWKQPTHQTTCQLLNHDVIWIPSRQKKLQHLSVNKNIFKSFYTHLQKQHNVVFNSKWHFFSSNVKPPLLRKGCGFYSRATHPDKMYSLNALKSLWIMWCHAHYSEQAHLRPFA